VTTWPIDKLMHLDFSKWRVGQTVLERKGAELRTGLCASCWKVGLAVEKPLKSSRTPNLMTWYIHIAIVDTLGYRLLPHKACAPKGIRGKAPIVYVPKVTIESGGVAG
jgi:hypothetical protein